MQRGKYDAVTIPILIPSAKDELGGVASFLPGFEGIKGLKPVRALNSRDLDCNTSRGKKTWKTLSDSERARLVGLIALQRGLESKDRLAIEKACARLVRTDDAAMRTLAREASKVKGFPETQLSVTVSQELRNARFVLWWNGERFLPAIYCADIQTGLYCRAMLRFLGGGSLGICPHCYEPFIRTRPDMEYCSIKHREAHRVARWRADKATKSNRKRVFQRPRRTKTTQSKRRLQ